MDCSVCIRNQVGLLNKKSPASSSCPTGEKDRASDSGVGTKKAVVSRETDGFRRPRICKKNGGCRYFRNKGQFNILNKNLMSNYFSRCRGFASSSPVTTTLPPAEAGRRVLGLFRFTPVHVYDLDFFGRPQFPQHFIPIQIEGNRILAAPQNIGDEVHGPSGPVIGKATFHIG
jgi:hypothetical protein